MREAFEAVLALIVVKDRSNEEALQFDRPAAVERAREFATPEIVEWYGITRTMTFLSAMSPRGEVRCHSHNVCELSQEVEAAGGSVTYDEQMCQALNEGIPLDVQEAGNFLLAEDETHCVTRFVSDSPAIHIGTVERSGRGGQWIVTGWRYIELQE